ncbi:hypothetical protein F4677DRAFT_364137 [Hypoxylon crocopeplum]|nr:hypothetical protein F4677DRAFT_364137 [Hypoxylon crocopeplum]
MASIMPNTGYLFLGVLHLVNQCYGDLTPISTNSQTAFQPTKSRHSPRPTPPPQRIVEARARDRDICGYYNGDAVSPLSCGSGHVCTSDNILSVIGCIRTEGNGAKPLATTCLGYTDYMSGQCDIAGPQTGCCSASELPYCSISRYAGSPSRGYTVAVCVNETVRSNVPLAWEPTTTGSILPTMEAIVATGLDTNTDQPPALSNQDIIAIAIGVPAAIAAIVAAYIAVQQHRKRPTGFWQRLRGRH